MITSDSCPVVATLKAPVHEERTRTCGHYARQLTAWAGGTAAEHGGSKDHMRLPAPCSAATVGRVVSWGHAARGRNAVTFGIHPGRYAGAVDDGVLRSQLVTLSLVRDDLPARSLQRADIAGSPRYRKTARVAAIHSSWVASSWA
jgi:hypothetical protein